MGVHGTPEPKPGQEHHAAAVGIHQITRLPRPSAGGKTEPARRTGDARKPACRGSRERPDSSLLLVARDNENLTENLDGEDATRLYLFFDRSTLNQSGVARAINDTEIRDSLGIESSMNQPTLNRIPGRMDEDDRHYYASETETLVRQLQDRSSNTGFEIRRRTQ
ncbi:hypothetical protein GCM10009000_103030 [Halobacterium noricense]